MDSPSVTETHDNRFPNGRAEGDAGCWAGPTRKSTLSVGKEQEVVSLIEFGCVVVPVG